MNRRRFLAGLAGAAATTAGCTADGDGTATPAGPATTVPEPTDATTPTVATRSGVEVVRLARHQLSSPIGIEALDARPDVAAMSADERVAAGRRWAREHVTAYEAAGGRYRAFLAPFVEKRLRDWYGSSGGDPPAWVDAVTGTVGEAGWIDRQAWLRAFEPGDEAFKYTFGGRRAYDVASHTITLQGSDFRGVDPDTYLYTFDDGATREAMAATVLRAGQRVWEQVYEFYRAFRDGGVTHAKSGAFNGAVVLVGGTTMLGGYACDGCGDATALRAELNHVNRLALLLEEFGFPPRPLDG